MNDMMRPKLLIFLSILSLLSACDKVGSRKDMDEIEKMEQLADQNREDVINHRSNPDIDLLNRLGEAYIDFADQYKEAPEAPEMLFRAGELYSNELQDMEMALKIFKRNYSEYPGHETAANALFFTGYLYNNSLKDFVNAEKYYKEFIEKYPDHNMARHAEFELNSLGMTDEQVFEQMLNQGEKPDSINPEKILP